MKKHPVEIRPVIFDSRQVELLEQGKLSTFIQIAKHKQYPSLLSGLWTDDYSIDEGNADWLTLDCPFGKVGHKLFVREKFAIIQRKMFYETYWSNPIVAYRNFKKDFDDTPNWAMPVFASVRGSLATVEEGYFNIKVFKDRWFSPVCMSKINSRHLLGVERVELKRLNAINFLDILQFGFSLRSDMSDEVNHDAAWDWLADSLEEKHGAGIVKENPLVWVCRFKEINHVV